MKNKLFFIMLLTALLVASCVSTGAKDPVAITLAAEDATLNSTGSLVLEEGDSGYNVGWWETTDDEIIWDLDIPVEDEYTFLMNFSCDPQFPGSTVSLTVNGQTLEGKVYDTGDWTNYTVLTLGTTTLPQGMHKVVLKATNVANRFVCNLQSVKVLNSIAMN